MPEPLNLPPETELIANGIGVIRGQLDSFLQLVMGMVVTGKLLSELGADGKNNITDRLAEIQGRRTTAQADVQEKTDTAIAALRAVKAIDQENTAELEKANQVFQTSRNELFEAVEKYYGEIEDLSKYIEAGYADEIQRVWKRRTEKILQQNFSAEYPKTHEVFEGMKLLMIPLSGLFALVPVPFLGAMVGQAASQGLKNTEKAIRKILTSMDAGDVAIQKKYAGYKTEKEIKESEAKKRGARLTGKERGAVGRLLEKAGLPETYLDVVERAGAGVERLHFGADVAKGAGINLPDPGLFATGMAVAMGNVAIEFMKEAAEQAKNLLAVNQDPEAVRKVAATIDAAAQAKGGSFRDYFGADKLNIQIVGADGEDRWLAIINGQTGHLVRGFTAFESDDAGQKKKVAIKKAAMRNTANGTEPSVPGGIQELLRGNGAEWLWEFSKDLGPGGGEDWMFQVTMKRQTSDDPKVWAKWDTKKDPFWGTFSFTLGCTAEGKCTAQEFSTEGQVFPNAEIGPLRQFQAARKAAIVAGLQADIDDLRQPQKVQRARDEAVRGHAPNWDKALAGIRNKPTIMKAVEKLISGNPTAAKRIMGQVVDLVVADVNKELDR